jgi:predicted transcriptional regulator
MDPKKLKKIGAAQDELRGIVQKLIETNELTAVELSRKTNLNYNTILKFIKGHSINDNTIKSITNYLINKSNG